MKKITGDELPDFYNIVLERPRDDPDGYDVLFIDAAAKASCTYKYHCKDMHILFASVNLTFLPLILLLLLALDFPLPAVPGEALGHQLCFSR